VSQHAACNGQNGAIDAVFANRSCALSALRQTHYTILTYGSSAHIHIGTDGWSDGGNRAAQRQPAGSGMASDRRANGGAGGQWVGTGPEQRPGASPDSRDWSSAGASNRDWAHADADGGQWSGRGPAHAQRAYARAAGRQRASVRVAARQDQRAPQSFDRGERLW
jgi:hypothetical protein